MLSGASNFGNQVDKVFLGILAISVFFLVLITFLMVLFVIKYRRGKNPTPKNIHGNTWLEITWTVIPTILVTGIFYYGWISYNQMRTVPEGAETIKVKGRMWSWEFEYKNGLKTDTLFVPLNKPVKLALASQDVIHSFYVPAFRLKRDVVPGINNWIWFEPKILGSYDILCAEYCGLQHSYMLATLTVLPKDEFAKWYEKKSAALNTGNTPAAIDDTDQRKIIVTKGCIACHSTDGTVSVGPSFLGMYGRNITVLTGGKERKVVVNGDYIAKSILEPEVDITKGFEPLMPAPDGGITKEEINQIIEFIKNLK